MKRELAILTFQTLDGVMQAPTSPEEDSSERFSHGGWASPYWEPVMEQVRQEAMAVPYEPLFGRKTYELFATHFPAEEDHPLNQATKHVVTSTLHNLEWRNSVKVEGDLPTAISRLKDQAGPLLQVHGSWQLIQGLLRFDLVDEFRLWTFPVVVGSGKRVFGPEARRSNLVLVKSKPNPSGAVMNVYRRAETG